MVILVIDPDGDRRSTLSVTLRSAIGGSVLEAATWSEGLEYLQREEGIPIDLVTAHVGALPEGAHSVQALTELPGVEAIPLVLLCTEETATNSLLEAGAYDLLYLPARENELRSRVQAALRARELVLVNQEYAEALEKLSEEFERINITDVVTGVASIDYFHERYHQEWYRAQREGQPLTLIFIDLDLFEQFNEHYGKPEGDTCLYQIGSTLSEIARRPADLLARSKGASFAVLLPNTHEQGARFLGERMREEVYEMNLPHDSSPLRRVTVSCGVGTIVPKPRTTPTDFLEEVDEALATAKRRGRNRVEYTVRREE